MRASQSEGEEERGGESGRECGRESGRECGRECGSMGMHERRRKRSGKSRCGRNSLKNSTVCQTLPKVTSRDLSPS